MIPATVYDKFREEVKERFDFTTAIYTGALRPITGIQCGLHGTFQQYAAQLRKPDGATCPTCGAEQRAQSRRTPAEVYKERAAAAHGGKYDYTGTHFTRMNARIDVCCPTHGVFNVSANKHLYAGNGCPVCEAIVKRTRIVQYRHMSAAAKVQNTGTTFFERCSVVHAQKYTYPHPVYEGAKTLIRAVCPLHGEFTQSAWKHLNGSGCPRCGGADPVWERECLQLLQQWGHDVQRSAPVLAGRHIDLYIPALKVGVELHGLHWHTEAKRSKEYHREKWEAATKQGIRLLQVFEDEWRDKHAQVVSRLQAVTGGGPRYAARKLQVRVVDYATARAFLERTHTQGACVHAIAYGLFDAAELVALATFGTERTGGMTGAGGPGWEVLRYASVGRVRGGFSRILTHFKKQHHPTRIVSYCDLRFGDGRLYAQTGFTLHSITPPDYWWVMPGKIQRVPRYTTQKHKLRTHPTLAPYYAETKTELQICSEAGWLRIYGVGHQKWVWTAPTGCAITPVSGDSVQQTAPADDIPIAAPHCM